MAINLAPFMQFGAVLEDRVRSLGIDPELQPLENTPVTAREAVAAASPYPEMWSTAVERSTLTSPTSSLPNAVHTSTQSTQTSFHRLRLRRRFHRSNQQPALQLHTALIPSRNPAATSTDHLLLLLHDENFDDVERATNDADSDINSLRRANTDDRLQFREMGQDAEPSDSVSTLPLYHHEDDNPPPIYHRYVTVSDGKSKCSRWWRSNDRFFRGRSKKGSSSNSSSNSSSRSRNRSVNDDDQSSGVERDDGGMGTYHDDNNDAAGNTNTSSFSLLPRFFRRRSRRRKDSKSAAAIATRLSQLLQPKPQM